MEFSWSKFSNKLKKWYKESPVRAIDRAYEAALKIQKLEEEYFDGNPIVDDGTYGSGTYTVIQTQLRNQLNIIRLRLLEYQLSNIAPGNWQADFLGEYSEKIATKLDLIDQYLARYESNQITDEVDVPVVQELDRSEFTPPSQNKSRQFSKNQSMIPPSILSTFQSLSAMFSTDRQRVEEGYANNLEQKRRRTFIAIRFFLTIITLAITIQWISKNFIYEPVVNFWYNPQSVEIKFDKQFKTEALEELRTIQETIELESLVAQLKGIKIDREEQEEKLRAETKKLVINYNYKQVEGIKNLLADLTSGLIIYLFIILGREQVTIVREFLYDTLADLSDSAKAFLIIVSTDTFVGYHSSDGWDALLKVLFAHFGLPESTILTDTFIATVPVFLDASFKYWIFQYLRRASPPTSAIYREMND